MRLIQSGGGEWLSVEENAEGGIPSCQLCGQKDGWSGAWRKGDLLRNVGEVPVGKKKGQTRGVPN